MSALLDRRYITEAEYLEREEVSLIRHEWFQGYMSPLEESSSRHATISTNIHCSAKNALKGSTYQSLIGMMRIRVEVSGLYTYSDGLIFCRPAHLADAETTLLNPKVIFEVLSDSTEKYDRIGKFEQYKQIPTLTDYVLIAQDYIHVEHFRRKGEDWVQRSYLHRSRALVLESVDIEIPLDEIYDELELPEPLMVLEPQPETN